MIENKNKLFEPMRVACLFRQTWILPPWLHSCTYLKSGKITNHLQTSCSVCVMKSYNHLKSTLACEHQILQFLKLLRNVLLCISLRKIPHYSFISMKSRSKYFFLQNCRIVLTRTRVYYCGHRYREISLHLGNPHAIRIQPRPKYLFPSVSFQKK